MKFNPPMKCLLCNANGPFSSEEHIVPHSLGNDILVLPKGWLCDACNNICSAFESRALSNSIFGLERCRLGVITKKQKPAKATLNNMTWYAEPLLPKNILSIESNFDKTSILLNDNNYILPILVHKKNNLDIVKMLLKIGLELLSVYHINKKMENAYDDAKKIILSKTSEIWPYFHINNKDFTSKLKSIFYTVPDTHNYIKNSLNFDLFLHEIDHNEILFFIYGEIFTAISITSRDTNWLKILDEWGALYLGCPIEYSHLNNI